MYVVVVRFCVKPDFAGAFRVLVLAQAHNSLTRESACRRFDVAFDPQDKAACLLYEMYDNQDAFDTHLKTEHFLGFDAAVSDGVVHKEATFWELESEPSL